MRSHKPTESESNYHTDTLDKVYTSHTHMNINSTSIWSAATGHGDYVPPGLLNIANYIGGEAQQTLQKYTSM